jgi:hypothetical protein
MRIKAIFFFLLLALVSCEITEDQEFLPSTMEDKLKEVMSSPIILPESKLKKVVVYGGNSTIIHSSREILYPAIGNVSFHVIYDFEGDTIGIGLNYFREELIETSHFFNYENGKPVWWSTREYQYLPDDRLDKIFHFSSNKERSLLAQYVYNSQNLLSQIEYPSETGAGLEVYEYDEFGRISKQWKSAEGQEEFKIDYLVYRYNQDLLVAMESGIRGTITEDRQDAYQFFYDENRILTKQKEFDPYFGFQQKSWSEYFYYPYAEK